MGSISSPTTLAVVSQSGESISFFDAETGELTSQMKDLLPEPHELCYDDSTGLCYCSHAYKSGWYAGHGDNCTEISVFDVKKRTIVGVIDISPYKGPHYLILNKKNGLLYSSVEKGFADGLGGVIAVDVNSRSIVKAVESQSKAHWFVMTPDGSKAYTCNKELGYISVLDLNAGRMIGKIDVPGGCEQPGISTDGKFAYFPTPTIGTGRESESVDFGIKVIDTQADRITRTIPLEYRPVTVHVDALNRLFVGLYEFAPPAKEGQMGKPLAGRLILLASPNEDFRELGKFEAGLIPLTVLVSPDCRKGYAANILAGTVTVVDLVKMKVEMTLDVDTEPRPEKKMHQGAHGLALF